MRISKGRTAGMAPKTRDVGKNDYLVDKLLKGLLAVSIVMMLGATLSMSLDNIMANALVGGNALAVMNLVMPLFVAISMIGNIISNGGSALAARYLGQNKSDSVNGLFTLVMLADLVMSVVIMALVYPNMEAIASLIGAHDPAVNAMTVDYFKGLLLGVAPILFNSSLLYFVRVTGNPKMGLVSTLVMAVLDIFFNWLLAGVFKMGMFGLALGTSLSYTASCAICVGYVLTGKCSLKLTKPQKVLKQTGSIINLGLPSAMNNLTNVVRGVALNVIVATTLGVGVLNVMSAQSAVNNIVGCASLGIGFAISPLVGIFFGEQDDSAIVGTMNRAMRFGLILNVVFAGLLALLARPIAGWFNTGSAENMAMIVRAIYWVAISLPFTMISYTFTCFYQNAKHPGLANLLIISKTVVFCIAFVYLTIGFLADNAVWISALFSNVMSMVLVVAVVWIRNKKFPTSMRELLLLPKAWDTGAPCFEVSLENKEDDCIGISQAIQAFCVENGVSDKVSYYTALCLEEMAMNVIKHGFKDEKPHFIDIKVIVGDDSTKMRIRDDGVAFNPLNYMKGIATAQQQTVPQEGQSEEERQAAADAFEQASDFGKNIGVRIVTEIAKHIDYRYTMRLNNLFIQVVNVKTLKLAPEASNWAQADGFLRESLAAFECPAKAIEQTALASEELFGIIAAQSASQGDESLTITVKPLEKGVSVAFKDNGAAFDPTSAENAADASMGVKIINKTMDIVVYSRLYGRNVTTLSKFW